MNTYDFEARIQFIDSKMNELDNARKSLTGLKNLIQAEYSDVPQETIQTLQNKMDAILVGLGYVVPETL